MKAGGGLARIADILISGAPIAGAVTGGWRVSISAGFSTSLFTVGLATAGAVGFVWVIQPKGLDPKGLDPKGFGLLRTIKVINDVFVMWLPRGLKNKNVLTEV